MEENTKTETNASTAAPAAPAAQEQVKVVRMYRWKNMSGTTLTITEGMITVPHTGYTPPMMEPVPSLKALETAGLMVREAVSIGGVPTSGIRAIAAGEVASDAPISTPRQSISAGPEATPPQPAAPIAVPSVSVGSADPPKDAWMSDSANGQSHKLREAKSNCMVVIGDGASIEAGTNLDPSKLSTMIKASKDSFSTEVQVGEYVKDEADKIIKEARQRSVVSTSSECVIPAGTPVELHGFFKLTHVQKKISIFKSEDGAYLKTLKNYEKDATVISCISQRLGELGIAD